MKKILILLAAATVALIGCAKEEPAHQHQLSLVKGQEPTTEAAGWKDYYSCSGCSKLFEDAQATVEIPDLNAWKSVGGRGYLAPLSHQHKLVVVPGMDPTCSSSGWKEYYQCEICQKYFEDNEAKTEIPDLNAWKSEGGRGYIPPTEHLLKMIEGQKATDNADGWKEYYVCAICGSYYEDDKGTQIISNLDVWKDDGGRGNLPGAFVKHEKASEPGQKGFIAYWKQYDATSGTAQWFEDYDKKYEITDITSWKDIGGRGYIYLAGDQRSIIYGNVTYPLANLKDNNIWFAQNLSFLPAGYTPCNDLTNVAAGVYYPVVASGSAAEFSTSQEDILSRGYLYQTETAFGVAVNSIKTEAQAKSFEGTQGICPPGWHIPTISEILNLVGKCPGKTTIETAPYYDSDMGNGSIAKLNEDNAKVDAYGLVSILDNTTTAATLKGVLSTYPSKTSSGYFIGSSFCKLTTDADGNLKNIQFYGFMPMTNKSSVSQYTDNGSQLSYKIGASLRCVKNH